VAAVEVVAAQPTESDRSVIAHMKSTTNQPLPDAAYLVKIRLEEIPPATGRGWALYVDDERIPKYWAYKDGIYFKVFDPSFFSRHDGQAIRFSLNGADFVDTGKKLTHPKAEVSKAASDATKLPLQADVMK
jgi:hypothetical protein